MTATRAELAAIVGPGHVVDGPQSFALYASDESFIPPLPPRHIARPSNGDEVQALIKWAMRMTTPLVPVSSGAPHHNGDTVPSVAEAVIVDLSRLTWHAEDQARLSFKEERRK